MRAIYLILICFAAPVAALIAWSRGLRDSSRRERLADRFGRPQLSIRSPVLWVHAASMGEVQAGATLVGRMLADYPAHEIVLTTMTTTGAARVRSLFKERVTHCYLPYDLPFAVCGFLDRARPQLGLILETELWPNLLNECSRRKVPVVIASARISPRTAKRYRWLAGLFRGALREVVVAAQTETDAERFRSLGAKNIQVVGNIKFDIDIPDAGRNAGAKLREQFGNRFVWVAGSTHAGEEEAALVAHRKLPEQLRDALLILVPRHPQRFDEVRNLLDKSGLSFVTRSSGIAVSESVSVLLVDSMGELLNYYAAADVAFVGGSLVRVGGHNLLEPAALGKPTLCGPYLFNSQDIADQMIEVGAARRVGSSDDLAQALAELSISAELRTNIGKLGANLILANRGAVSRVMDAVASAIRSN